MKNALIGFTILGLLLCAGIAVTDEPKVPEMVARLLRSPEYRYYIAGVIVLALSVFVLRPRGIKTPRPTTPGPPVPINASLNEVAQAQSFSVHYGDSALLLLMMLMTDLPRYLVRINEDVELLDDSPQLRITKRHLYRLADPRVEKEPLKTVLVPIARLEKGTLLDNFDVKDSAGDSVPTVSYNQLRGLLSLTLEILIASAISSTRSDMHVSDRSKHERDVTAKKKETDQLIRDLILKMCGPPRVRKNAPDSDEIGREAAKVRNDDINAVVKRIETLPVNADWQGRIRSFCELYIDSYVILAEVEYKEHLMLSYSHLVPANVIPSSKQSWRRTFGLRPSTIDIALNTFAFQVETYHQELTAQSGQYVFQHRLELLDTPTDVKQPEFETQDFAPYVRVYYNDARSNAHLYVRRQAKSEPASGDPDLPRGGYSKRLKSVIELREIPPGTLGAATVVALASAAIISFFAISHTGLDIDPAVTGAAAQNEQIKATLNSDVPALLLALPAFIGVLIGSWLELARLRRASLTTYLALAMTMFLSIASALFFVFDANRKLESTATTLRLPYPEWTFDTDWVWLLLMAVAVTHVLFLFRSLVNESRHFSRRGKKPVEG